MKSQALIMNVVGAILLFVAILLHIVCMATPHMAGVDFPSIRDDVNRMISKAGQYLSRTNQERVIAAINPIMSIEMTYGPWKRCVDHQLSPKPDCDDWEDPKDWIKATQAFSLLGVLAAIGAILVSAISLFFLFKGNWKKILPILACVLACGAAGLVIVEAIIFAAKYSSLSDLAINVRTESSELEDIFEDATYLDWGFGLDIVAAILLIVAGLIHVLSARAAQREGSV